MAYITNTDLLQILKECHRLDRFTNEACLAITQIVQGISRTFVYANPLDQEDCESQAMYEILRYWKSFDITRNNPFAYFSQVTKRAIQRHSKLLNNKHHKYNIEFVPLKQLKSEKFDSN